MRIPFLAPGPGEDRRALDAASGRVEAGETEFEAACGAANAVAINKDSGRFAPSVAGGGTRR
jgi:hypothetical protein